MIQAPQQSPAARRVHISRKLELGLEPGLEARHSDTEQNLSARPAAHNTFLFNTKYWLLIKNSVIQTVAIKISLPKNKFIIRCRSHYTVKHKGWSSSPVIYQQKGQLQFPSWQRPYTERSAGKTYTKGSRDKGKRQERSTQHRTCVLTPLPLGEARKHYQCWGSPTGARHLNPALLRLP